MYQGLNELLGRANSPAPEYERYERCPKVRILYEMAPQKNPGFNASVAELRNGTEQIYAGAVHRK